MEKWKPSKIFEEFAVLIEAKDTFQSNLKWLMSELAVKRELK